MQKLLYSCSSSLSELPAFTVAILKHLQGINILFLQGDLGSGKTTLTQHLLKQMGVVSEVTSPSFNLVSEYRNSSGQVFYHFDLYRIRHINELTEIGFFEYLDSGNLCLIEWPEIAEGLIHDKALKLQISYQGEKRLYELWNVN